MKIKKVVLHPPTLEEAAKAIEREASTQWECLSTSVVDCPDLSLEPWGLAASGLCGQAAVVDIGGPGHLFPCIRRDKIYDLRKVCDSVGLPSSLVIGPGAAPHHKIGHNAEGMYNANLGTGLVRSMYTEVTPDGGYATKPVPANSTDFALMGNFLLLEGLPGKVLRIEAQGRISETNYTDSIRFALAKAFPDRHIALGGAFLFKNGKARLHVMPDFPSEDFNSLDDIGKEWLRFYEMPAPLTCLSVLHSGDLEDYALRVEHTHCYSAHGAGGHYHHDVTPKEAHYVGYFVLPSLLYRLDQC